MTEMQFDAFRVCLRRALGIINPIYFGERNLADQAGVLDRDHLDKAQERAFCYELYHQLRKRMDAQCREVPGLYQNMFLTSEYKKRIVNEDQARRLGINNLAHEYIPDFLLHVPQNADEQGLAIEVKATRGINTQDITDDLDKLKDLIINYNFSYGIFIAINKDHDRLYNLIGNSKQNGRYADCQDRILIIDKERASRQLPHENYLSNI